MATSHLLSPMPCFYLTRRKRDVFATAACFAANHSINGGVTALISYVITFLLCDKIAGFEVNSSKDITSRVLLFRSIYGREAPQGCLCMTQPRKEDYLMYPLFWPVFCIVIFQWLKHNRNSITGHWPTHCH